jgi:hypothetical protein
MTTNQAILDSMFTISPETSRAARILGTDLFVIGRGVTFPEESVTDSIGRMIIRHHGCVGEISQVWNGGNACVVRLENGYEVTIATYRLKLIPL